MEKIDTLLKKWKDRVDLDKDGKIELNEILVEMANLITIANAMAADAITIARLLAKGK